jgi:tRNA(Ile)-lysidine synthase
LSGGVDSVALLDALHCLRFELGIDLSAIHVNHGFSANAGAWALHCAEQCHSRGIPFVSITLRLELQGPESLEAVARDARYDALADAAATQGSEVVALGHHLDDQAETVLLQLLRGGSPKGLAAMPDWRFDRRGTHFWRPLLSLPRAAIADYATAQRLRWIEDESNIDRRLLRNLLRHDVFPILEQACSGYRTSLARAARRAQETVELLDKLADLDASACIVGETLSLVALRPLGALRVQNVLHRWLSLRGLPVPDSDRLAEFVRQVLRARIDRQPSLRLDAASRLASAGRYIEVLPSQLDAPFATRWRNESEIILPHGTLRFTPTVGSGIDASKVPHDGLLVRPRNGGERLKVGAGRPTRTLKNLLQEAGVAAPLRRDWPLIVHETSIVAVPGIGVGVDWQCPPGSPGWTVAWEFPR